MPLCSVTIIYVYFLDLPLHNHCYWAMCLSAYGLFVSSAPVQLVLLFLCVIYLSVLGMAIFESQ